MVRARGHAQRTRSPPEPPEERATPPAGPAARPAGPPSRTGRRTKRRGPRTGAGRRRARPRRVVPRDRRRRASSLRRAARRARSLAGAQPARGRPHAAPRSTGRRHAAPVSRAARGHRPARDRARGAAAAGGTARSSSAPWTRPRAGRPWTFYEGPPTANGMPGVHHVEARVFKDAVPPVQDHAGLPRAAPGRLGLPRPAGRGGGREGTRAVRQEGDRGLRDRRVQRALPRVGAAARGRVRGAHRADGLLGRPVARPTARWTRLHRVGLVVAEGRSSTRACWSGTTGSARTARAARRRCPITRWASRTCTGPSPTRR